MSEVAQLPVPDRPTQPRRPEEATANQDAPPAPPHADLEPAADTEGDAHPAVAAPEPAPEPVLSRAQSLLARLKAAPHRFSFYAIMRHLEALHPERPRFGQSIRPEQDLLRLGQEPSVIHAPAALSDFEPGTEGKPGRLRVYFFGLFGPDGPLPLHLTEYARDRRRNYGDRTFQSFADLFHHRTLSLFYRAWAASRPTVSFDRPDQDRFAYYVGSLIGLSTPGLRDRDAMPDLTKLHFAGLLASQPRNAEGLGQILSAFFDMPVRVESMVGAWLSLPPGDYTHLGDSRATAELGSSALLGKRVWSRQHKFRIVFGPLSLAEYKRLLPGGLSLHRLIPIVRNYAGDSLIWDVSFILRAAEVPRLQLGRQGQLGWTTWLTPRRSKQDAADLFLDASADSHAVAVERATHKQEAYEAVS
jgi:type VI secretion system protein ImpH